MPTKRAGDGVTEEIEIPAIEPGTDLSNQRRLRSEAWARLTGPAEWCSPSLRLSEDREKHKETY